MSTILTKSNKVWKRFHKSGMVLSLSMFILFTGFSEATAQNKSPLKDETLVSQVLSEQKVSDENLMSITFTNVTLERALEILAERLNVGFSYNPDMMPNKLVSFEMSNVQAHEIIYKLLEGTNLEPVLPPSRDVIILREKKALTVPDIYQETVTGTVVDAQTGEALAGVNVIVEGSQELTGSTIGTTTDIDGQYEIQVPDELNTIVLSYIGYTSQRISIDGRDVINVELRADVQFLEDLVVVGYGTQERQQITGSVSSVSADNFVSGNVERVTDLIQGKVPGLIISQPGGANPNDPAQIRLRGVSTFGAQQSPLIVIDGIIGASLENIDPNDIASIDVLKDASASAIYGTRGAAGVIQITTKRGTAGETNISYNTSYTTSQIENRIEMLSGEEFRSLGQELGINVVDFGADTDWIDEITQRGWNNVHSLAISGGSSSTNYRVSGNYRKRQGLQITTGNEIMSGRLNINHRALDDKLALTLNLGTTNREEGRGFENAFGQAIQYNPTAPTGNDHLPRFVNTGGWHYTTMSGHTNPKANLMTRTNEREDRSVNTSLRAQYYFDDFAPGLSLSAFYSRETLSRTHNIYASRFSEAGGEATEDVLGNGSINRMTNDGNNELFETTINYTSNFERLEIDWIGGYSYQDFFNAFNQVEGTEILPTDPGPSNIGFAQSLLDGRGTIASSENENTLIAGFSRLSLNYDNTYFLNTSLRREGSSRFGIDNKWGTFWSAGLGIEITNLINFVESINSLRFRTSYGVTGQDAPFNGISQLRFGASGNFLVDGNWIPSFGPTSNSNSDLRWEESGELNIGFEIAVLNNRLNAKVEYYNKTTSDLLFEREVPVPPNIFPLRWENIGGIENEGIEVSGSYEVIRRADRNWTTGFTFSTFRSELTKFVDEGARYIGNMGAPGQSEVNLVRIAQGEPLGQIWGARFAGVRDDGVQEFFDVNGNRIVSADVSREDEQIIGNGLPDFTFGWDNRANYKNWDLNLFIRGTIGHDLGNTPRGFFGNPAIIQSRNALRSALDNTDNRSEALFNSSHVEDASFARIENLTIGYTFLFDEITSIRRLRTYASVNNLYTFTNYSGMNPDVRYSDGGNPLIIGIERLDQWFTERSFTIGINLDF